MYPYFKRLVDLIMAFFAMLFLIPVMIPIMIALKFSGEHHIFYFQDRVGFKNKLFSIWKFATMLKNSSTMEGGIITTKNDPRMTPLGPILRKTKINELPQIINVIKGDMSFIGPRPVMQESFSKYPIGVQEVIYNVRPGISGIGSIIFRDEEELITEVKKCGGDVWDFYSNKIYPYKGKLEEWYQEHQSFSVDLKILLLTAYVIFVPRTDLPYRIFPSLPQREF